MINMMCVHPADGLVHRNVASGGTAYLKEPASGNNSGQKPQTKTTENAPNVTAVVFKGTYGEEWCKNNNIKYIYD